ncbi:MAG: hypothetical protein M0R74_15890, partial [Dehalococcoidia bacterium]|nr:hypothetical protein [Dehalococcoidia bacterium]
SIFVSAAAAGGSAISPLGIFKGFQQRRRLSAAFRAGHGRYTNGWSITGDPVEHAEEILAWVRETVAGCRRPYGFAAFDLELSLHGTDARPSQLELERWEPTHLYAEGGHLVTQVRAFLSRGAERAAHGPVQVVAVLSSWGDLAHAVMAP